MRCLACFAVLLYHEHFFHGSTFSLSNEPSYAAMRQTPVLGNFFLEISWHMTLLWLISGFLCERQLHQMLIRVQVRRRQQQQHNHRQQKQYYHQRQIAVQREEEPTKNSSNNTSSNDWISPAVSSREAKQLWCWLVLEALCSIFLQRIASFVSIVLLASNGGLQAALGETRATSYKRRKWKRVAVMQRACGEP